MLVFSATVFLPQVWTPGLLLPARSPALDELRVLAAGCRACSTKNYVDNVLHARGTKNVDVRAAGVSVRFELEPSPGAGSAAAASPPSPQGCTVNGETKMRDEGARSSKADEGVRRSKEDGVGANRAGDREEAKTAEKSTAPALAAGLGKATSEKKIAETECFELSVGCCIYQKGKYLLGHAEGEDSIAALRQPSSVSASRAPSLFQPPLSPHPPQPLARKTVAIGNGESGGTGRERASGLPLDTRSSDAVKPPLTTAPSSMRKEEEKLSPMHGTEQLRDPATRDLWGGGPGPKPCEEAVAIIKSLRVPLSDPHYLRVADTSLYLGVMSPKKDGGAFVRRTQVLGGGEGAYDGWAGELLITRCAVVGNPRQPRTRADAMLSRIRVEVRWVMTRAVGLANYKLRTTGSFWLASSQFPANYLWLAIRFVKKF